MMSWSYFQMLGLLNNSAVRGLYGNLYVTIGQSIQKYICCLGAVHVPRCYLLFYALIRDQVTKLSQRDRVPVGR